jgi:hypothetical protein
MNTSTENISAAAALGKIAEMRQYGIEESYSYLIEMEAVQIINNEAKKHTGVDLLNFDRKISSVEIERYEEFLEKVIEQNLTKKLSDSFLEDELTLLEDAKDYPLSLYRTFDIKSRHITPAVKQLLNSIGIITPSIASIVKDPLRVVTIDKQGKNFLSISKINLKSKNIYLLFHIATLAHAEVDGAPSSFQDTFKNAKVLSHDDEAITTSCILFSGKSQDITSPLGMFLNGILRYGYDITIDFITKRFFLDGYSSKLLIRQGKDIIYNNGLVGQHEILGGMQFMRAPSGGYKYGFLYSLNTDKIIRDYKSNNLL